MRGQATNPGYLGDGYLGLGAKRGRKEDQPTGHHHRELGEHETINYKLQATKLPFAG